MKLRKFASVFCTAMAALWAMPAASQVNPLSTTAGLKAACENSAGNVVVVSSDTAVNSGYSAGYPEQVRTGCRIQLTGGADIQFDKVGLAFAGPLVIVGGAQSGLQMQEASLAAPNVLVQLTDVEAAIKMEISRIDATGGNLDVRIGALGKIEVIGSRTAGSPLSRAAFVATGNVSFTSGRTYTAMYKDTGIVSGGSIAVTATGGESSIGFENSGAYAYTGDVRFDLASSKSKLESSNAAFTAVAGHVALAVRGGESVLSASNTAVRAGATAQVLSAAPKTEVIYSNGSIVAGGGVQMAAYPAGFDGTLLVDNVQIQGGGDIVLLSGLRGKTMVSGNRITGNGLVRAATSTWGICEAHSNQVAAPLQQLCI